MVSAKQLKGKGTITYAYDATGMKEAKTVVDSTQNPVLTTTTKYIKNYQYTNDTLAQTSFEEGRARWQKKYLENGNSIYSYFYDYFMKDHLGNTRVILTTEKDTSQYIATMEPANRATENALFDNIDSTSYATSAVPGGYPGGTDGGTNDSVAMVDGSPGNHTQGPAMLLKVKCGDSISLGVNAYFVGGGSTASTSSSLSSVLNTLAGGLVSLGAGGGENGVLSTLDNPSGGPIYTALNSFLPTNDPSPPSTPKAYLNWMLLDNQFNYVSGNNQSGAIAVGNPNVLNTLATTIKLKHSGYLYIWVSNETQNWMVFFDNLSIQHFAGPMLEETHYYPFGLTMAGISDKALKADYAENKYRFNKGSELQNKEFSDGTGLEMYETQLRELDPQVGRWWQIDSKPTDAESPYSSMGNNPILRNDALGDEDEACCKEVWNAIADFGVDLYNTAVNDARVINTYVNPVTPFAELATGKSVESDFSQDKSRVESAKDAAIVIIGGKVEDGLLKAGEKILTKETEQAVGKTLTKAEERAAKLSEVDRSGKDFTKAGKDAVKDVNTEKNGGQMKCENCGQDVQNGEKHTSGKTPPSNEAHVDHVEAKAKGGSGTPANGQVLCRNCNLKKRAK